MSYLFVAYLYDKRRCSAKSILGPWADAEPAFAGESLVRVSVSPRVEAVFYVPGSFRLKSLAFSFGCEVFLVDDWAAAPAEALRKAGEKDWQYVAWVSSDMSDYDVAMRFTPDGFDGRAMIDGEGERVAIDKGILRTYEKRRSRPRRRSSASGAPRARASTRRRSSARSWSEKSRSGQTCSCTTRSA